MTGDLFLELAVTDLDGQQVAYLLPEIPEDAPGELREGLARRRLTVLHGECPCGAKVELPNREARRRAAAAGAVLRVEVEHEDGCPAVDRRVRAALGRWSK